MSMLLDAFDIMCTLCAGNALQIGCLDDLRAATKGGLDPNGTDGAELCIFHMLA